MRDVELTNFITDYVNKINDNLSAYNPFDLRKPESAQVLLQDLITKLHPDLWEKIFFETKDAAKMILKHDGNDYVLGEWPYPCENEEVNRNMAAGCALQSQLLEEGNLFHLVQVVIELEAKNSPSLIEVTLEHMMKLMYPRKTPLTFQHQALNAENVEPEPVKPSVKRDPSFSPSH